MNHTLTTRTARAGLAVLAALLLVSGAAWHGFAASSPAAIAQAATVSTPIQHAIAGGRDSYADVVDVVSPAVVTVRAEGRARVSPTQFQFPDHRFEFFAPASTFQHLEDRCGERTKFFRSSFARLALTFVNYLQDLAPALVRHILRTQQVRPEFAIA